jgi:uncharacterized protein (TIGR00299 family) protein
VTDDVRGRHLHVDCASGAAGDMMLGALIDLGVPVEVIGDALDKIGAGRKRLKVDLVNKSGIAAIDVKVDTTGSFLDKHDHGNGHGHGHQHPRAASPALPSIVTPKRAQTEPGIPKRAQTEPGAVKRAATEGGSGAFVAIKFRHETHSRHVEVDELGDKVEHVQPVHGHGHAHGPGHGQGHGHDHAHAHTHEHHHYAAIRARIDGAALPEGTKRRALDIFDRIARAEAKIHNRPIEDVTFHEVGAIDSIVDVVGTAAALDWLNPISVSCTGVAMGHGSLQCAHGILPVPAPAALEVMREAGGIMTDGGIARELCTPTGAAILAATVTSWKSAPSGRPVGIGWGAGDSDLADRANVLRVIALEPSHPTTETVWQIDANLDDMSPELCGAATEALFLAGAVDVWFTPITMKKGRPAFTLSALADDPRRDNVIAAFLRETTTIGVRYRQLERTVLERVTVEVTTRYGSIPIKVAREGEAVRNAAPEYDACAAAARRFGVPVKLVFAAALAAYEAKRG